MSSTIIWRAGPLVVEEAVRRGPSLASASSAHAFVREFDGVLAANPALRRYRLDRSEQALSLPQ